MKQMKPKMPKEEQNWEMVLAAKKYIHHLLMIIVVDEP